MKTKTRSSRIPQFFKPLFWGYDFNSIDSMRNKNLVIVNALNYGDLRQWKWLVKRYGRKNLRETISLIPRSEFRKHVVKLIELLFNIKEFKYASRSAKIRAEKNI